MSGSRTGGRYIMRRLLFLLAVALTLAVGVLVFAGRPAALRPAVASGPGMSLQGPATVVVGETFTISIVADPAPDVEIQGFATEVLLPVDPETGSQCANNIDDDGDGFVNDGCQRPSGQSVLQVERAAECANSTDDDGDGVVNDGCPPVGDLMWLQRPSCEGPGPDGEVQVGRQDGERLQFCLAIITSSAGVGHSVGSAVARPPLPPLDVAPGSTTTLVELDLLCMAPGVYDLVLTASSLYGTAADSTPIPLKTVPNDLDGDTVPEYVADVLSISCAPCPAPCRIPAPAPAPALSLESSCSPDAFRPDEDALLICSTTIANWGDTTLTDLRLTRRTPPRVGRPGSYTFGRTVNGQPQAVAAFDLGVSLPQLPPGETIEVHSRFIVRPAREGLYGGEVSLIANNVWVAASRFTFDAVADADYPPSNLLISKTVLRTVDPPEDPGAVAIELVVSNQSEVTMTSLTVLSKHSNDIALVSADPPTASLSETTGIATWELGPLGPGEESAGEETPLGPSRHPRLLDRPVPRKPLPLPLLSEPFHPRPRNHLPS